jgi:serine protease Do
MSTRSAEKPQGSCPSRWASLLASLSFLWPVLLSGEIFRYQDEQGGWHFTDDPPEGYEYSVVPDIATAQPQSRNAKPADDLEARLESAYSPITPIAYATLAVVSIKTEFGEGSGFFCSDQGHILTNKHVVRPESSAGLDESEQTFVERERELGRIEANLKESRRQLQLMKRDLEGYERLIGSAPDDKTRSWARDARQRLSKHYRSEQERISSMEGSVRTLRTELKKSKRELGFKRSYATASNRFKIILKDGTELTATLVKVSDVNDLALLKLDGYRTPFLRLDASQSLSQGARVFAIGNPLGMQDAVTSGVITQITPEYLLTDAQVLPGSSGGPLIRESGEAIGINVSRKVAAGASKYSAGFGKAIPIALATDAFAAIFDSSDSRAFRKMPAALPLDLGQTGDFTPDGIESSYAGQTRALGPDGSGISDSAPVRLIVPDEDGGPNLDQPSKSKSGSLDFPPEGSGIFPAGSSSQTD